VPDLLSGEHVPSPDRVWQWQAEAVYVARQTAEKELIVDDLTTIVSVSLLALSTSLSRTLMLNSDCAHCARASFRPGCGTFSQR
jgi:hypothetical protein